MPTNDANIIRAIADRAVRFYSKHEIEIDPAYIVAEVRMVHYEVCYLRLQELLDASESDFVHDITGIHKHLDILNGSFRDGFCPRFAKV